MTDIPLSKRRPIHGVAVDQGSGLATALREARGAAARDDDLFRFKQLVARTMSAEATTLLVDAQYGRALLPRDRRVLPADAGLRGRCLQDRQ